MKLINISRLFMLSGLLIITNHAWAGDIGDQASSGAASIATGALRAISAPLIIAAGASTGDSTMLKQGLDESVTAPFEASAGAVIIGSAAAQTIDLSTNSIVHLVNASGKKLENLDDRSFDFLYRGPYEGRMPPTAQITLNHQPKTIPLVVRKQYVEMNERVDKQ